MRVSIQNDMEDPDYTIKLVLVGESFVGKTSIVNKLVEGTFQEQTTPTVGIDFGTLDIICNPEVEMNKTEEEPHDPSIHETHYKLQIWDCAGQERFRSIVQSYYKRANIVFIVFDVTDKTSFDTIDAWVAEVRKHSSPTVIALLGNKIDNYSFRNDSSIVSKSVALRKAKELELDFYMETSAASSVGLRESITKAMSIIYDQHTRGELLLAHTKELGKPSLRRRRSPDSKGCFDCNIL